MLLTNFDDHKNNRTSPVMDRAGVDLGGAALGMAWRGGVRVSCDQEVAGLTAGRSKFM